MRIFFLIFFYKSCGLHIGVLSVILISDPSALLFALAQPVQQHFFNEEWKCKMKMKMLDRARDYPHQFNLILYKYCHEICRRWKFRLVNTQ
jgi:hypothetical protein